MRHALCGAETTRHSGGKAVFMIPVCSAPQAAALDACAIHEFHIPSLILMEHACQAIAREALAQNAKRYVCFAGPGNNGADALAAARLLSLENRPVVICMDPGAGLSEEERVQLSICKSLSIPLFSLDYELQENDLIIDGLFGNGLSRPVTGRYAACIDAINQARKDKGCFVLAIDVPSGLNASSGRILGTAVQADLSVVLGSWKTGCFLNNGPALCGRLVFGSIGMPEDCLKILDHPIWMLDSKAAAAMLPERSDFSFKNRFSHALIAAGSLQMQGAACMAADACLKGGIGLLSMYVPQGAAQIVMSKLSMPMITPAASDSSGFFARQAAKGLALAAEKCDVVLFGNGVGLGDGSLAMLKAVLSLNKPTVIDADGITLLAKNLNLLEGRTAPLILTPHLGEFSRLAGLSAANPDFDVFLLAHAFCKKYPFVTLVVKSDFTLICSEEERYFLFHPTSALAKGGSGDSLAGLCTALLACCKTPAQAGALAAWICNEAAHRCRQSAWSVSQKEIARHFSDVFLSLSEAESHSF